MCPEASTRQTLGWECISSDGPGVTHGPGGPQSEWQSGEDSGNCDLMPSRAEYRRQIPFTSRIQEGFPEEAALVLDPAG